MDGMSMQTSSEKRTNEFLIAPLFYADNLLGANGNRRITPNATTTSRILRTERSPVRARPCRSAFVASECQRRMKVPQKCRSKNPHSRHAGDQPVV